MSVNDTNRNGESHFSTREKTITTMFRGHLIYGGQYRFGAYIKTALLRFFERMRAGLKVDELSGRSLRAGCVTQATMSGVREFVIMRQTSHKTVATLRHYVHSGEIFRGNAAAGLGI